MAQRLSTRGIVRFEVQDLFQEAFQLVQSARQAVRDRLATHRPATDDERKFMQNLDDLTMLLRDRFESLRARILSLVG